MENLERYLVTPNPNLSIILPGGCNCSCEFCFWKESSMIDRDYPQRLCEVLDSLPHQFQQISITGGEATISPFWGSLIDALAARKDRFPKKVLNTNGTFATNIKNSDEIIKDLQKAGVYHVNWSRHHYDEAENWKIFGNHKVPNQMRMQAAIDQMAADGIDVTLNTVMGIGIKNRIDVENYIKMAHNVGATGICFRKEVSKGSDLSLHSLEELFMDYKEVASNECPVCRGRTILFRGCPVTFKAGLLETAKDGVYELILQPNGDLTIDWAGKQSTEDLLPDALNDFGASDVLDRMIDLEDEPVRKKVSGAERRKAHKKTVKTTKKKTRRRPAPLPTVQYVQARTRPGYSSECGGYTGGGGCG